MRYTLIGYEAFRNITADYLICKETERIIEVNGVYIGQTKEEKMKKEKHTEAGTKAGMKPGLPIMDIGYGAGKPIVDVPECGHGKENMVYAVKWLGNMRPWICSECGLKGKAIFRPEPASEYEKLFKKFHGRCRELIGGIIEEGAWVCLWCGEKYTRGDNIPLCTKRPFGAPS